MACTDLHDGSALVLALNCGSSSIKFKSFCADSFQHKRGREEGGKVEGPLCVARGSAKGVGGKKGVKLTVSVLKSNGWEEKEKALSAGCTHADTFSEIVDLLESLSPYQMSTAVAPIAISRTSIRTISHRIVHGGDPSKRISPWKDKDYVLVTKNHKEALGMMEELSEFAPLHNHAAVRTVSSCLNLLPQTANVLLFDTTFHKTIPEHVYTYPIPPSVMRKGNIPLRRYGFHGLSYSYILKAAAKYLNKPPAQTSLIVCHLGSGASVCAIKEGKSIDTSMGLTPLEGLPGVTRAGTTDPTLVFHLLPTEVSVSEPVSFHGRKITKAEYFLNRKAGLQSVAGTDDFKEICKRMRGGGDGDDEEGTRKAKLAFDIFVDRVVNFVGSYYVKLAPSLDALVFSGGIGEHSPDLRREVCAQLAASTGVRLDDKKNDEASKDTVTTISRGESKITCLVCKTDEETECAEQAQLALHERESE